MAEYTITTTTGTEFANYIRRNASNISDSDILLYANRIKNKIAETIVANTDEFYFDLEDSRDLVGVNEEYPTGKRTYAIPRHMIKVHYVAAKLDGENWTKLNEYRFSQFDGALLEEDVIKKTFAGKAPRFYLSGREITILSGKEIIDVDGGFKVKVSVYPENLTQADLLTNEPLIYPSNNKAHRLPQAVVGYWQDMVIISWKQSRQKPLALTQQERVLAQDENAVLELLQDRVKAEPVQMTTDLGVLDNLDY